MTDDLPIGWIRTTIADVVAPSVDQCTPTELVPFKYIDISSVNRLTKSIETPQHLHNSKIPSRARQLVKANDVLVSMTRPNLNAVALVQEELDGQVASTGFDVLRAINVEPRWLFYLVRSQTFVDTMSDLVQGALYPAIRPRDVRGFEIPLAPFKEQKRIADKLDVLLGLLNACRERLTRIPELLIRFRQSILDTAMAGALTAEWRTGSPSNLQTGRELLAKMRQARQQLVSDNHKTRQVSTSDDDSVAQSWEIPNEWCWVRPEDVTAPEKYSLGIGPFGSNLKVSDYRDSGVPLVFVRNITSGDFDLGAKYISPEKFNELHPHAVKALDLLITKMGDPPGDCEIYPADRPPAVITSDCLKFRVWDEFVDRTFFKYCIQSSLVRRQLVPMTKGVAQPKISLERFKGLQLPLPSLEEQRLIATEVGRKLRVADYVIEAVHRQLARLDNISAGLLSQAFSGELVPQDPTDEPAAALLERIKLEQTNREHQPKHRTTKQRKRPSIMVRKVLEVLAEESDWLEAQEVFRRCGITDGATTEEIEELYTELRALDKEGRLAFEPIMDSQNLKVQDRLKLLVEPANASG